MRFAGTFLLPIITRDGEFVAHYSPKGLARLDFPPSASAKSKSATQPIPASVLIWHRTTTAALERTLAAMTPRQMPPLDLSAGTSFQQRVWNALRRIKAGKTRSYGEIAREIGNPKAVRAVGGACGANPIPVLVPCHRVLAANRRIGGFSGGLEWKRKLLGLEGVQSVGRA